MRDWLRRLHPFQTPEAQRLALLFAVVYFAQGMWTLPVQTMTIVLKERGLSASGVADFLLLSTIPWVIKPVYGLLSDFVPLFGRRRQSYFLLTSGLASVAGFALALAAEQRPAHVGDRLVIGEVLREDGDGWIYRSTCWCSAARSFRKRRPRRPKR